MSLNVLIVSPLLPATGNFSTVLRLQCHFSKSNFNVSLMSCHDLLKQKLKCNVQALNDSLSCKNANCVLLLHALKSGACVLCSCPNNCKVSVKYAVIFGGTDLNEDVKDKKKLEVMKNCVEKSEFCVVFSNSMHVIAKKNFPSISLYQHPQALDYSLYDHYQNDDKINYNFFHNDLPIFVFVLPCSIRPVKDPLYIVDEIIKLKNILKKDVRLLILGPITDYHYGKIFFSKLCQVVGQYQKLPENEFLKTPFPIPSLPCSSNSFNGLKSWLKNPYGSMIQYIPALSQMDYFYFLEHRQFFAVLNTSVSEGMSSAILEAMIVGVPVVARDILGNKSIIIDKKTGLLFSSPDEFVQKAAILINDCYYFSQIVNEARVYVIKNHSPYNESSFYSELLNKYFL